MDGKEFAAIRSKLEMTQKQMAELLGRSLRAVQSFEQGWRKVPENIERQLLYLVFMKEVRGKSLVPCWELKNCPMEKRDNCPAWEFNTGQLCWFINGTICQGKPPQHWDEKLASCRLCPVFDPVNNLLQKIVAEHEFKKDGLHVDAEN